MGRNGKRFETLAVTHGEHAGDPGPGVRDVVIPLHLTSTYELDAIDPDAKLSELDPNAGEYVYSRLSNPTRNALEERLAALEGGRHGFAFASGMAAITATLLSRVEPGDHVVAFEDLYGGTKKALTHFFEERMGVALTFVDATDTAAVAAAMRPETELLWMETPTNPLMHLCDIEAIAAIADEHDALLGVDNTFASPQFQRPLELGADVVVHSTTKYLNGHSDSVGGAVVTDDDALAEEVAFFQRVGMGAMLAPFDAYMVLRGVRTLPLRMERHEANATALAAFLEGHDAVSAVHYPGLESHPQHDLASRQMSGYGGMLSFELDADLDEVQAFVAALDLFPLAVSLGGVESLIEHPASMTHSGLSDAEKERLGITESLLRISAGIEAPEDLLADLDSALSVIS